MSQPFTEHPLFMQLGFSDSWIDSGLLSESSFEAIVQDYGLIKDDSSEHYRWKIFKDFIKCNTFISEEIFRKIYDLSLQDSDYAMGRAMRFDLIKRQDCPTSLIEEAVADGDTSLRKQALKQRAIKSVG